METNEELYKLYLEEPDAVRKEMLRNDFFERNSNLSYFVAKKFSNLNTDLEDLASIANVGMIKAFNTFSLEKKVKFITYAVYVMNMEILQYARKIKRNLYTSSLDEALFNAEGDETNLMAMLADDTDVAVEVESHQLYNELIQKAQSILTGNEYTAFMNFVSDNPISQRELSERLGVSQSIVSRYVTKAIVKLRKGMVEYNV